MTDYFVVYGTLKKGYGNNRLLQAEGVQYLGTVVSKNEYVMLNCGFPLAFLVTEKNDLPKRKLLGELYRVENKSVINNLDRLESNGSFYLRSVRSFKTIEEGLEIEAWIYEIPVFDSYYRTDRLELCQYDPQLNSYYWGHNPLETISA